jgi:ubiquinone/menaquinone biosynthesis C-methylase UbiE/uncharacterized protein YbaR (Trm112 family)
MKAEPSTGAMIAALACAGCQGELRLSNDALACDACRRTFAIVDGIPIMLLDDSLAAHDELEHQAGHDHKHRQAAFFDQAGAAEFETNRPHGAPPLYGWLIAEKFRRSMVAFGSTLEGSVALAVCAGSGMDAELLTGTGAHVISSDISLGAARRTRDRARRYGLDILAIVADVEHLPFRDRGVDLVYVHDGLHHLERPLAGLTEMARVAGRGISLTEPARAAVTALAVRLGLALEREEAGNRVARLTIEEITSTLVPLGFKIAHAERYAMYYRHEPGQVFRVLSTPALLPVVRNGFRALNRVLGPVGNKLTVQAIRH